MSGHCQPIKYLCKREIQLDERYCNVCDENEIGIEPVVMVDCTEVKLREQFKSNRIEVNYHYEQFFIRNMINTRILAQDISTDCYLVIFPKKVFSLVKSTRKGLVCQIEVKIMGKV